MGTFRGAGTPSAGDNFPSVENLAQAVAGAELAEVGAQASELAASTSEANAATSETNAATSAGNAATSETNAAASDGAAATSASNAATSETNAGNSASAASVAQLAAEAALDEFTDLYLGAKASDPTLDNDGNALQTGALYFNTAIPEMRVYDGSTWGGILLSHDSFAGAVDTSGSVFFLPPGWTAAPISTGRVRITHNLGIGSTFAVAVEIKSTGFVPNRFTQAEVFSNTIDIGVCDGAGVGIYSVVFFTATS